MAHSPFRVGILGLQPGRSWAAVAHLPALRALTGDDAVTGVANTTLSSAEAAAAERGIPNALASAGDLLASPDVDIILVTVKVPYHRAITVRQC